MTSDMPVGAVCAFAGQVDPISTNPNAVWTETTCGPGEAVAGQLADAPLSHLEAQGWMLCDGRLLAAGAYPELFAVLGTLYGQSSPGGELSFRLPDYRGLFLRGLDAGAGMDPGAATRTAPTGGSTSNVVGSLQCDALQTHTHHYDVTEPATASGSGQAAGTNPTSTATSAPDSPALSSPETRPRNIAVNYVIKFT